MTDTHFVNPIAEGADPAVVRDGDRYLWSQSEGNVGISIWVSDRPTTLGTKHIVWRAPAQGACSQDVWAPELFHLDERWYVYFAASDGNSKHHLTYVLESDGDDPLGSYALQGPLQTGDSAAVGSEAIWAIDMTVLEHGGDRYAIWSGWPAADKDAQRLYLAPLTTPTTLGADRAMICEPGEYTWERIEENRGSRGLAEAPQVLQRSERTFVTYSCAASWLPTYKLGILELVGDDPMVAESWRKSPDPVFISTEATYGVGHSGFTTSPDGREWWHVYHAKRDREPGWRRAIFAQPMRWRVDGTPDLGQPVPSAAPVPIASGTPSQDRRTGHAWRFGADGMGDFDYYGHHQYVAAEPDGVHLGIIPAAPVNSYRSGEKIVVRDGDYRDLRIAADFEVRDGSHDVGLIFRVTRPAVGFDAQRGYFAGISAGRSAVVLGAMNGHAWREIAIAPAYVDPRSPQRITVEAVGPAIRVYVGTDPQPAITVSDADFTRGSVGFRVVDTHAVISSMALTPL